MRLHGKRALITGGSDGIGLAIAEAFLREGADVLIVGRDAGKLEAARQKLTASGPVGTVETLSADLATSPGIAAAVEHAKASGRPLDVLVNNAGVAYLVPFETVSEAQFQHSFALNVSAAFFLTQGLLQHFGTGASVINISSYFADKMIPKRPSSLYSLSKGALNSLTKSLAFELGPRGIRVNAIAPGTVDTAMRRKTVDNLPVEAKAELKAYVERSYPLGRIGRPDDLAGMAVYLASDEAAWTSGAIFAIDGGYTAG
ncbi:MULTISPECIES: SDR family oxidoreductase [unclassified Mesorhizobium]|uniref:SDR family NAD(P)-dependent oxidoreductase n=1 Tax=unclassified Mesorhizobium TaxID=325217 RepID=UPI000FD4ACB3|nr:MULTISPECIES: SDR family oxidoreductase [unclassified Mesorhizobium]RUX00564.1 SDR family oxidoreductase [Mesorhizobium sp. M8A.F.Ca.ET.059.01.1.1]TGR58612.1 SDR family oxidoreductase [bacterium M00.F.Ca.ET.199.01.1.1]TGU41279.1 SDR family oxidoreductase [bacterium M00.F.Ca.ET.156.01.1.1]TGV53770.1 SDR family oxidoreductase [bacterium M00.F.Ca.ET.141.01.1.1]TGV90475.1 SDR family oxidoreductase [Mesorhizobium sp. M00.F.Ca.ET.149.01.1.1]